jgi:hypothetical protein
MRARVSNIEAFRYWRQAEDQSVEDLIERLTTFQPNEAMLAGTAFHKALEDAKPGDYERLHANGYTFILPEGELYLPPIRELRAFGNYGPLQVTGCVDVLDGKRVDDHKTTGRFDPERYLSGCQWKFYLDLLGADVFRWNVFEIRELEPRVYEVADMQMLEAYRYPGLHADCLRLATEFYEVMSQVLPDYDALPEAA